MTTKEKIKKKIDLLPEELLDQVQEYIKNNKLPRRQNKEIRTLHLKGQYDNINLRKKAYE